MMNTCSAIVNDRPGREQLAEVVLAGQADADAAAGEHHVEAEDREHADRPSSSPRRGRMESLSRDRRDGYGRPLAEAGADEAALREAEQAVDELDSSRCR